MSMADLRALCVQPFVGISTTRDPLMLAVEGIVRTLVAAAVQGAMWVDGSFLTIKIDPNDADVLLQVEAGFYNSAPAPLRAAMDRVASNLKASQGIDSYLWVQDNPGGVDDLWWQSYWIRQFGFSRENVPKGIALIIVPPSAPAGASP